MRFAVNIPPFTDAHTIVDMAVDAEDAGWDGVFVWDHLQLIQALKLDIHDPWSLLSAMAMRTERVVLGPCVTPLARRRPWVVAKQLTTLDHLSGGRAIFGVGLGDPSDADFEVFGDAATHRERAALVDEGLEVLDGLLRGHAVTHHGLRYDVEATFRPPPVQSPRPRIYVAGMSSTSRKPLERALRWDGFFPIGGDGLLSPQQVADRVGDVARPDGWELFASLAPGWSPEEFAAAGVTWLVEGAWPEGDWVAGLRARISAGPPR